METHSLENCIRALKKVRDAYSSQFDTSVMAELDLVIEDLERVNNQQISGEKWKELSMRSLQMIATILRLISDVRDWMK
ncbi:hypothetical protein [Aquabacterium sp. OR-4]|uniref:hypothetical protein n=1 Tax=Aquabacterium sp. OR-4 TaxID=2978127 RepID=UPI0028C848FB|nr:hypothetical protein [Aquabacterium sp. OR-4]MDT7838966.1 hypothetical protein [Aquabacterium sp. OR-4]